MISDITPQSFPFINLIYFESLEFRIFKSFTEHFHSVTGVVCVDMLILFSDAEIIKRVYILQVSERNDSLAFVHILTYILRTELQKAQITN
jgi:hypothetical protein